VAIPPTSESAPAPAAPSDRDQMLIVELRESDPKLAPLVREAEDSDLERGWSRLRGRKGTRAEYRCAACGYGIVVYGQPPSCLMCSEARWEHVEWRPFPQLLDDLALPVGTGSQRRRLHAPSSPAVSRSATFARVKPEHRPEK
jgi:hypothetical protein